MFVGHHQRLFQLSDLFSVESLIIGNQYQGTPEHALDAVLDDLYIYGRVLDYEQILTLSQIGK